MPRLGDDVYILSLILFMAFLVVGINYVFSGILGIIASLVMISLGINLIGIFRNNLVTLPSFIFSFFRKYNKLILTFC